MVWISNITKQYDIKIEFKEEMLIPKDFYNNSHKYLELKVLKPDDEGTDEFRNYKGYKRLLDHKHDLLDDEDNKYINDKIAFTWEVKDYSKKEIQMQLYFKKAYKISRYGVNDKIDINFLNP